MYVNKVFSLNWAFGLQNYLRMIIVMLAYFSALLSLIFPISQFICLIHLATLHFLIAAVNYNSPAMMFHCERIRNCWNSSEDYAKQTNTYTSQRKYDIWLSPIVIYKVFYLQHTRLGILCLMWPRSFGLSIKIHCNCGILSTHWISNSRHRFSRDVSLLIGGVATDAPLAMASGDVCGGNCAPP